MDQLIDMLCQHAGIDRDTAMKVIEFFQQHASEIPALLRGAESGGLSGVLSEAESLFGNR